MAAELNSAEYAFLIILNAEGRKISNTEMDKIHKVRLVSPNYERLNAAGYVTSDTNARPYRHTITDEGRKLLAEPLSIGDDTVAEGEKRSPRDAQLWAAIVALQRQLATLGAAGEPAGLEYRIRAGYAKLAAHPGEWVNLVVLRSLLGDAPKAEVDRALEGMLNAGEVRLEPEPFGHRLGAAERRAAVHIGGEDRHKLAIGLS